MRPNVHRVFWSLSAALMLAAPAAAASYPSHFRGALLGTAFQENAPSGFEVPVEQMTREQLQLEYTRLEHEKPGIAGAIAITAVGGALLVISIPFLYVALYGFIQGLSSAYVLGAYIFLIFGAALAITGGVLLAVGLVKMFQRIGERRAYSQRMDDINARLESLDRTGAPPAPPPPETPPESRFFDARPGLVLATF